MLIKYLEKLGLVRNVQRVSRQVVQDFEGYTLDFNETAMVNHLLVTDDPEKINNKTGGCI